MVKGLFIMNQESFEFVYPEHIRTQMAELADIYAPPLTCEMVNKNPSILQNAEVIFSGWGGPRLDQAFLDAAPNLKVLFYAAGSIKQIATEHSLKRNIVITTAVQANAIPVIEFTLSQILFCLKSGWQIVRDIWGKKTFPAKPFYPAGGYQSTVGLISLSTIGKGVAELLKHFDVDVIAYDPYADTKTAYDLGVTLCSLEHIFRKADIVSVHTPLLETTRGMIRKEHFSMMKENACFINTARGAIIREEEMIDVLKHRKDLTAVLDVTNPEPPVPESFLYTLPNVILTPHIAGSKGQECARMGVYMLEELKRYVNNEPLKWRINQKELGILA
ncbi:glycerate dehydrogenase [Bacillus sp. SA1-12]|uniref:hydroxyacid dehydrogenase n=1 Tax=Bacillus sp. SA1-12 TaxID=1455638 RepID=UPI0006271A9E|nr:hydroxyacid dehydrogenase [Bacillus sp. SA1-12]KKI90058.1 glycerate dehydrogenase [Bacillus sp. SA1-12]